MTNQILRFGKHKGKRLCDTPLDYQQWLTRQSWFRIEKDEPRPPVKPRNMGEGRRMEAYVDSYFEYEKQMADLQDSDYFNEMYGY